MPPQDANPTPSFGGFGVGVNAVATSQRQTPPASIILSLVVGMVGPPWWPPSLASRRSRRWWSPGRGARRRVPRPAKPGPATSPGRVDGRGPTEAAQEGAQGGWRHRAAQGGPGAQHIGVVNAVAPSQRRRHQRHHLVARVRPPRGIAQGAAGRVRAGRGAEGGRRSSPALTKRRSSKVIWIRSGWLRGSIYWVLLFRGRFFATKPLSQKHRSTFLPPQDANPTPSFGGFGFSEFYVVPVSLDYLSTLGIGLLLNRVSEFAEEIDRELTNAGIVISRVGRPARHREETEETIRQTFEDDVLTQTIRERSAVSEAASAQIPVHKSGNAQASKEFKDVTLEILIRIGAL